MMRGFILGFIIWCPVLCTAQAEMLTKYLEIRRERHAYSADTATAGDGIKANVRFTFIRDNDGKSAGIESDVNGQTHYFNKE
jgi:hypothetical protein